MAPRVGIVGAGAVGLVYARYLRGAGARVALLIKPEHADACANGIALHHLKWGRGRSEIARLDDLATHTSTADFCDGPFDQIWVAVASDAMRKPWLGELLRRSGDATVVILQPDLDDRGLVLEHVPEERLVHGLIGFLSFQSPLPRAPRLPEGIVYTLLPGTASSFDGARASQVVALLRQGGFPARRAGDLPGISAERSATTVPLIAGLEAADWSLQACLRGPWLTRSMAASREALAVVAASLGRRPAAARHLLRPLTVRLALSLAPRLTPFDLEAYLSFHFTKVGPQTRLMLETYARQAASAGLPSTALRQLRSAL